MTCEYCGAEMIPELHLTKENNEITKAMYWTCECATFPDDCAGVVVHDANMTEDESDYFLNLY